MPLSSLNNLFTVSCCLVLLLGHATICQGSPSPRVFRGRRRYISWADLNVRNHSRYYSDAKYRISGRVIWVSKDGSGDSKTVQGAVDMVPDGNNNRVRILVSPGVYREKVVVPETKPYISFIGKGSSETVVITYHLRAADRYSDGQAVGTYDSASVAIESDFFCANGITFQNTAPAAKPGEEGGQAVALRLTGDRAMLYRCRILGSQDTLFDHLGRHYFFQCFIQGSIDIIFGSARSLYQSCSLRSIAESYGAVAASQRNSPSDNYGFSFVDCKLSGTGKVYLGRAWGRYATVVYSNCQLEGIVLPEAWSDWGDASRRRTVFFGQFNCKGEGAELGEKVGWARSLSYVEAKSFLDRGYIDGEQWLDL
ncbi:pectinesterase QRT1-like [Curcuma longa]|uniref:pectinesterase QRT1-like n=1 Tax=Curcuma longa TaxID=136217 RepID=UPI003D9E7F5C